MKISVVVTVKNDPRGEEKLRGALARQTRKPDEVLIIRAEEHGNCSRAEGRNIGIRKAKNDVIAITDAGCTPHPDWLEKLEKRFQKEQKDKKNQRAAIERSDLSGRSDLLASIVVAGFYRVVSKTLFQQAVAPYLVVFPDQWNERYLPASRSIAFTKQAWGLVDGYPEEARSGAEDLVFASRLVKHQKITVLHAPDALVDWEPPQTLPMFFRDVVKHTKGNRETRYWPHLVKNYSVLFRWLVFLLVPWLIPIYLVWPVIKHGWRAGWKAIPFLPIVQVVSDAAVVYALIR